MKINLILKKMIMLAVILSMVAVNYSIAANKLTLTNFSKFGRISNSSNFTDNHDDTSFYFYLGNNVSIDSDLEKFRYELDRNYYDFNFTIGFDMFREKPTSIQFSVILESKYAENGTYLDGEYGEICRTSLVCGGGEYLDLVYRIEFYPDNSYVKRQSSAFIFYSSYVEFSFVRSNGTLQSTTSDGSSEEAVYDYYTAKYDSGINRTLDGISIELSMLSLPCNTFTINVHKISGTLYSYIIAKPITTPPPISEISLNVSGLSILIAVITILYSSIKVNVNQRRKE